MFETQALAECRLNLACFLREALVTTAATGQGFG